MIAKRGQTYLDLGIQHAGHVEACFDIALQAGASITDDLTPGIELADPVEIDREMVSFYKLKQAVPATKLEE
ncbi:MAG: hypothetical protein H6606_06080 [Flavobacteriales bacterium]|nr:hypothetical protein [Flavobacteriales bacterium]